MFTKRAESTAELKIALDVSWSVSQLNSEFKQRKKNTDAFLRFDLTCPSSVSPVCGSVKGTRRAAT